MLIYTLRDAKVSKRIAKNCIEDFTELLRSSLQLNFKMYEGKSMHIACLDGHEDFFSCIIVQEAYVNIPYKQQKKTFKLYIEYNHWKQFKMYLPRGAIYCMDINKLFRTRENTTEIREIVSKFIANLLWERRNV